jgi:hypothetical protein
MTGSELVSDKILRLARRCAHRVPRDGSTYRDDSVYFQVELRELLAALANSDSTLGFLDPIERGQLASDVRRALPVDDRATFDRLLASREREIAARNEALYQALLAFGEVVRGRLDAESRDDMR